MELPIIIFLQEAKLGKKEGREKIHELPFHLTIGHLWVKPKSYIPNIINTQLSLLNLFFFSQLGHQGTAESSVVLIKYLTLEDGFSYLEKDYKIIICIHCSIEKKNR